MGKGDFPCFLPGFFFCLQKREKFKRKKLNNYYGVCIKRRMCELTSNEVRDIEIHGGCSSHSIVRRVTKRPERLVKLLNAT